VSAVVAESQKPGVELSKDEQKLSDLKEKKEKSYNALLEKVSDLFSDSGCGFINK